MFSRIFYVQKEENYPEGKPINQPTSMFSEIPTDDKRCPLCKRFPVRFEYDNPRDGGKISVCARCDHHVSEFGLDDLFFWAIENIKEDDGVNLRWSKLADYKK